MEEPVQRFWGETCLMHLRKNKEASAAGAKWSKLEAKYEIWYENSDKVKKISRALLTNGKTMAFAQNEIGNYFQSLQHMNDICNDCFKNNTLANILRMGWRQARTEQLTQLNVITENWGWRQLVGWRWLRWWGGVRFWGITKSNSWP